MNRLKNLEKEVRAAESGNTRLEKTLYQAEKDNNKLVLELKEKGEEIKRAENKLKTVSNSITDIDIS
jgi:predicted  nucleic acid-binding Zn-ribbon protein